MLQIFVNTNYDFVGKRRWFYLASLGAVLISIISIVVHGGLNYGIDFTGGTLIQVPQSDRKSDELTKAVQGALSATGDGAVEIRRVEFVGPQVGRDLQLQALYAVLAGMAGILIYVAIRSDYRGGMISIAAIAHDVIVTLGALSIANREMSLPVLAALLTIVGYSINDTIVVFDSIRESRGRGLRKGQS